jgi:hypothetical protein
LERLVRSQDMPADHAAALEFVLRRANILYVCGKNVSAGGGAVVGNMPAAVKPCVGKRGGLGRVVVLAALCTTLVCQRPW